MLSCVQDGGLAETGGFPSDPPGTSGEWGEMWEKRSALWRLLRDEENWLFCGAENVKSGLIAMAVSSLELSTLSHGFSGLGFRPCPQGGCLVSREESREQQIGRQARRGRTASSGHAALGWQSGDGGSVQVPFPREALASEYPRQRFRRGSQQFLPSPLTRYVCPEAIATANCFPANTQHLVQTSAHLIEKHSWKWSVLPSQC